MRRGRAGEPASRRRRRGRGRGDSRQLSFRRQRRRRRRRQRFSRRPGALRLLELCLDVPHLVLRERLALRPRLLPRRAGVLFLAVRPQRRERVAVERVAGAVAHHRGRELPAEARVLLQARAFGVFLAPLLDERHDFRDVLRGHRGVVPLGVPGVQQLVQPAAHRHLAQHLLQRVAGEHLDHLAVTDRLAAGRGGALRVTARRDAASASRRDASVVGIRKRDRPDGFDPPSRDPGLVRVALGVAETVAVARRLGERRLGIATGVAVRAARGSARRRRLDARRRARRRAPLRSLRRHGLFSLDF